MLRTKVIASSISNLTDARYFAAWGVEAMGFDLQEISVMQVNAFKDWISGPQIIGQFSSAQNPESIQDVANSLELDMIQLDPLAPESWKFTQPSIQEVLIEEWNSEHKGLVILKSEDPHFSVEANLEKLKQCCSQASCVLDTNIGLKNLETILDHIKPEGIVLRGGHEEKVGFKSYDELDEIMEFLDED